MLPDGVLTFHHPFLQLDHATLLSTVDEHVSPQYQRVADPAFMPPELIPDALHQAQLRRQSLHALAAQSDALLRDSVLETSHWGYVVARTHPLFHAYNSGRASRLAAVHAMQRLCLHVSGSSMPPALDDAQVRRMCHAVFSPTACGEMRALPKGRTAVGIVLRPATGRFAKRLRTSNEQLIMLTREPDHETASITSMRLRGNYTCAPLDHGRLVYWDNRFVLCAAPISGLEQHVPQLRPELVFEAAVQPVVDHKQRMQDCSLYVRQLRRSDWDLITSVSSRARHFQIPFECIRALPAVFQKQSGSRNTGELVASPHLGLSARPDLYFVAVRMPRFRCLPPDIEPGFTAEQYEKWIAESGIATDGGGKRRSQRLHAS